ncbi:hypothetical protein SAMN05216249_10262 [Acetitomaculum ruminis DSM 5522]|uniref:Uncharacterized protein n=1 Tax=Acetitomaculum ruminis DSM 5522 TaxID=1120918 RepID=A0A1I0VLG3_9FIRM|nr:hypothetical protein [Acetitomaculum ruminis]SFA76857.1 hypothetical protein SAMN05216249_10262 [Acetitomaculum ruminis DSM 5522]
MNEEIKRKDLFSIPFYKLEVFTGSFKGMNYKIAKETVEDKDLFGVYIWKGPLSFDKTSEEKIRSEYEFTSEGLDLICDYLNLYYSENKEKFENVPFSM